jgi:hypothetical protein
VAAIAVSPKRGTVLLRWLLTHLALPASASLLQPLRVQVLRWMAELMFDAQGKAPPSVRAAFAPFLSTLTHEEMAGAVLPIVDRLFKRSPDLVTPSLQTLFASVSLDLSRYYKAAAGDLLAELRHADDARRRQAVLALQALVRRVSDADVLRAALDDVGAHLLGKAKEQLSQAAQRVSFLQVLEGFSEASSGGAGALRRVAEAALELLAAYLDKEAMAQPRELAVAAAGRFAALVERVPARAQELLLQGLTGAGKDKVAEPYFVAALRAVGDRETEHAGFARALADEKTADALLRQADAAEKNPGKSRRLGLLALALVMRTAGRAGSYDPLHPLNARWGTYLQGAASFVNTETAGAKLPEEEAGALSQLTVSLLRFHMAAVRRDAEALRPFFGTVVRLLCHPTPQVRRGFLALLRRELAAEPGLGAPLLRAFVAAVLEARAGDKAPAGAHILYHVLLRICAHCPAELVPSVLLVCHHPWLHVTARARGHAWTRVQACWARLGTPGQVEALLRDGAAGVSALLLGAGGLTSEQAPLREAAVRAVTAFTRLVPLAASEALLPRLLALLEARELRALSKYEQAVFRTRDGVPCDYVDETAFVPVVTVASTGKSSVKHTGLTKQDEAWIERTKKEIEDKKRAASGELAPEVRAKVDEERAVRARIHRDILRTNSALEAVAALAVACPVVAHEYMLQGFSDKVAALVTLSFVAATAADTYNKLAACCDRAVRPFASALSAALLAVAQRGSEALSSPATHLVCEFALARLAEATKRRPLSAPSFVFVSPLVCAPLLGGDMVPGQDAAMRAFSHHCLSTLNAAQVGARERASYPCVSMVQTLLHVVAHSRAVGERASEALHELSPSLRPAEIAPLLGEDGLLSPLEHVRLCALVALELVTSLARPHPPQLCTLAWLACHDAKAEVAKQAGQLWDALGLELNEGFADPILPLLAHSSVGVRAAAAAAIAGGVRQFPGQALEVVRRLVAVYTGNPDKEVDGRLGRKEFTWNWPVRQGVVVCFSACVDHLSSDALIQESFRFFLNHTLADLRDEVWTKALDAALRMVDAHGAAHVELFLPLFESYLEAAEAVEKRRNAGDEALARADRVREACVVCIGRVSRFLPAGSPKVLNVVQKLLQVIRTPSHSVQESVAACLPPLMAGLKDRAEPHVRALTVQLLKGDKFSDRKGAAFALGAMAKGLRIPSLKAYGVLEALCKAVQDAKNPTAREASLFAYQRLFYELGTCFEPYVIQVLPHLLSSFSDSTPEVRDAAQEAAQTIMAQLTGHGVKLVLPVVLRALEERAWRTKLESILLLGAMAYCAPKQLSQCLPQIVPKLLEMLVDPQAKVSEAASQALKTIASVIRNPELHSIAPSLLAALEDASANTRAALQELIRTKFVHSVDSPSLALIVPILRRGLRTDVAVNKRMAAQVVGCITSLVTDISDLLPYAPTLLKYLKLIVVDPVPDVRSSASRALGSLFGGVGEAHFPGLTEWIFSMLRSEIPVQRSGAAQALSQLLFTIGAERTKLMLPDLYDGTTHTNPLHREGCMEVFVFLPEVYGARFSVFLEDTLPVVMNGLADIIGPVREVSLRAAQALILKFAKARRELLMPALENGLRNPDWRIRLSSLQLMGVLLLRISGAQNSTFFVAEQDEQEGKDSTATTSAHEKVIEITLGAEYRDELYSKIYLLRHDVMNSVRTMAWRAWKAVVQNTPRMMTRILPTLTSKIIFDLASEDEEKQVAASEALGELVQKMGDHILQLIIPILQERLKDKDGFVRQGACLGLSEIMASAKKRHITAYMGDLTPAVRDALCDDLPSVRRAAGLAFQTLYNNVGNKAIEEVVPGLLMSLDMAKDSADSGQLVLDGLREILAICNKEVLPDLIGQLVKPPLSTFHANSLAALSDVLGGSFHRYVSDVTEAFLEGMCTDDEAHNAEIRRAAQKVVVGISEESVTQLVDALTVPITCRGVPKMRAECVGLLGHFCANTEHDFQSQVQQLIQACLCLFTETDAALHAPALAALSSVVKSMPEESMPEHVSFVRQSVSDLAFHRSGARLYETLPGLNQKGGLDPLLPLYQHCLMHGTAPVRQEAARALGDLIDFSEEKALGPYVIKITGPLIRIVGDRFPAVVKAAILHTLCLLLKKAGKFMKPFLPQLQATFLKALKDSSALLRGKGAWALSELVLVSKKLDTVVGELVANAASTSPAGVRVSSLQALIRILSTPDLQALLAAPQQSAVMACALDAAKDDAAMPDGAKTLGLLGMCRDEAGLGEVLACVAKLGAAQGFNDKVASLLALTALAEFGYARLTTEQRQGLAKAGVEALGHDNL